VRSKGCGGETRRTVAVPVEGRDLVCATCESISPCYENQILDHIMYQHKGSAYPVFHSQDVSQPARCSPSRSRSNSSHSHSH
jgi:hypothetical protein